MSANTRLLLNALLRLVFLGFALWIALGGEAALPGAPMVTRVGVVLLFLGLSILLGEVAMQRDHLSMLLKLIRAGSSARRDDREAVDILIQGLSSSEAQVRERALHHLRRLTGQNLPADAQRWQAWWAAHREGFAAADAPAGPAPGA